MKNRTGFTLIELMVSLVIVGILFATAMPLYNTCRQRAIGSEVKITAQNIMNAQIGYFLEHNKYYPPNNKAIDIYHDTSPDDVKIKQIAKKLHITIPVNHKLNFSFNANNEQHIKSFVLIISSEGGFDFFEGVNLVSYQINEDGVITSLTL